MNRGLLVAGEWGEGDCVVSGCLTLQYKTEAVMTVRTVCKDKCKDG